MNNVAENIDDMLKTMMIIIIKIIWVQYFVMRILDSCFFCYISNTFYDEEDNSLNKE